MIDAPDDMCGSAALVTWKKAPRFVAIVRSHSSSGISSRLSRTIWKAALFTSTSTRPNSSTVRATRSRQFAGSVRSPGTTSARRPASSTQWRVSSASSCSLR